MNAIRIRRKLDSETLELPELRPLLGKEVEITVQEAAAPAVVAGNWDLLERAAKELKDYDFDAYLEQREYDRLHAYDHVNDLDVSPKSEI